MKNLKYLPVCMLIVGLLSVVSGPLVAAQEGGTGIIDPATGDQIIVEEGNSTDHNDKVASTNFCGSGSLLGLPAWYRGLAESNGSSCDIKSPTEVGGVGPFIWIIVFNIVEMLLRLSGYAAVAFIIYGGYKYMTSAGSADGIAGAKKTITNAVIGLVISIAAVAIVNTVANRLLG